jgi:hypothetical protein
MCAVNASYRGSRSGAKAHANKTASSLVLMMGL